MSSDGGTAVFIHHMVATDSQRARALQHMVYKDTSNTHSYSPALLFIFDVHVMERGSAFGNIYDLIDVTWLDIRL